MSEGNWVKIQIEKDGIYKLTYSELKKMGFVDPSKVAVFGYGGWPLEEDFTLPYVDDLPAVPVLRKDDYILFYGRGTTKWKYREVSYSYLDKLHTFIHTNNPYSEHDYYYLTDGVNPIDPEVIRRMPKTTGLRIETFDDHLLHEKDLMSINKSGRKLYERIVGKSQVFKDLGDPNALGVVEGRVFADCGFVTYSTMGKITLSLDKNIVASGTVNSTELKEYVKGIEQNLVGEYIYKSGENLNVKIDCEGLNALNAKAYLDYIRLNVKRRLKVYDEPFTFFALSILRGRFPNL
ncbi:MAG: hypothetical protein LUD46_22705 [Parabacteroides sp.]|nr:hypothetical protein [Parabacteroides sp.]